MKKKARTGYKHRRQRRAGDMRKPAENGEICVVEWLSVEYRKKVHGKAQGTFGIFFGNEHMLRKLEMEEDQFNKEAKQGGGLQQTRQG